eukprot:882270-Amphidinium_carterae.2
MRLLLAACFSGAFTSSADEEAKVLHKRFEPNAGCTRHWILHVGLRSGEQRIDFSGEKRGLDKYWTPKTLALQFHRPASYIRKWAHQLKFAPLHRC